MEAINEMPSGVYQEERTQGQAQAPRVYIPGRYEAKPVDWGFSFSKDGSPQATILFEFAYQGSMRRIMWFGSFKERAAEITLKALVTCGCRTTDESVIAQGVAGGALAADKPVSITIGNHEYNGKTSSRVEWVNEPGAGGIRNSIAPDKAKAALPNFAALMKDQMAQAGVSPGQANFALPQAGGGGGATGSLPADEIPF